MGHTQLAYFFPHSQAVPYVNSVTIKYIFLISMNLSRSIIVLSYFVSLILYLKSLYLTKYSNLFLFPREFYHTLVCLYIFSEAYVV